jgi:hypothetical protein
MQGIKTCRELVKKTVLLMQHYLNSFDKSKAQEEIKSLKNRKLSEQSLMSMNKIYVSSLLDQNLDSRNHKMKKSSETLNFSRGIFILFHFRK